MRYSTRPRTKAYRCTLDVVDGALVPHDASLLYLLRLATAEGNRLRRAEATQRASWTGRLAPVTQYRVQLEYRGPRFGARYHSPKTTAYAADVYVYPWQRPRMSAALMKARSK